MRNIKASISKVRLMMRLACSRTTDKRGGGGEEVSHLGRVGLWPLPVARQAQLLASLTLAKDRWRHSFLVPGDASFPHLDRER